ncbi:MAG TPA: co-chaperone GroES [bacterium]|nr:co-chaperone GroES [Candidatus Magasanikbacteria bacterium]USN52166.1 MAG: co-chaperone GroES [Candidatus Nomurabacteria bacterium]HPF94988.1 co-chaperone GroES [bacterium]
MNIHPLHDGVVLTPSPKETQTASGFLLADTEKQTPTEQGTVIAVGPGRLLEDGKRVPVSLKIGDVVLFKKYASHELTLDKQEYLVVSEADILAIINT